jgi:hypothetical protein
LGTLFSAVYNRFLGKITDDLYLELTPEDTLKDLHNLLINSIPGFEFPRKNLFDYTIALAEVEEESIELRDKDTFILGPVWGDLDQESHKLLVDDSHFNVELTHEEINILAILMK